MSIIQYDEVAMNFIKNVDSKLGSYIEKYGFIRVETNPDIFESVVTTIIGQQLSLKAAETIEKRVRMQVGTYEPITILSCSDESLRNCGLSYRKIEYIKEFALKVRDKVLIIDDLDGLSDEEVVSRLIAVKGIGRWTAEMLAMFSLGRLDIFAYDDLALKKAVMKIQGYKTFSKIRYERLKRKYSPYGTIASIYYYEVKNREGL
jgi:DNA-3-methyladenine glycosylase II